MKKGYLLIPFHLLRYLKKTKQTLDLALNYCSLIDFKTKQHSWPSISDDYFYVSSKQSLVMQNHGSQAPLPEVW